HPLERVWAVVVDVEEFVDGGFEFADTVMGAPLELLVGEDPYRRPSGPRPTVPGGGRLKRRMATPPAFSHFGGTGRGQAAQGKLFNG
ncbi:MAG: hypothetical protein ABSA52_01250, partial [Candidatus Binatia bacterium]